MPSVRNEAGINSAYSWSVSEAYGAAPLLCHVSSTNGSLFMPAPHFSQFSLTLSIQGRWSSKSDPSGSSAAFDTMSCLEKSALLWPHLPHDQIGRGVPHTRSREMHQ